MNKSIQSESEKTSLSKKYLKVLVKEGENVKVNVNIPLALAEIGLKLIPKENFKIKGQEINIAEIIDLIKAGNSDQLIDIDTQENGKEIKIKIYVE